MRTLPLLLIVAAALVAPSQAFAAGGSTPTSRYFVITGLVLGDQKYEASGKIGLEGNQLMASVGCNSIGGVVTVDGDLVTIPDSLAMTEMACPGVLNEDVFVKILQRGPFHISATSWDGDGAQILVDEVDAPAPGRTLPPDQPIGSSPDPIDPEPGMSCPPIQIDPGFTGGSTGSGGSGSGGGSAPGAGSTGSEGNSSSGENPTGTAVAEPAGTAIAEPVEVPPATPATEPGGGPDPNATPGLDDGPAPSFVDAPPPSGVVEPDPGTPTDPGIGTDPGVGKPPVDGQPPVDDPCARYYATDVTGGAGAGAIPPQADGIAAAEHDKAATLGLDAASIAPAAVATLVVLLVFAVLVVRRWRTSRPATPLGTEADASR